MHIDRIPTLIFVALGFIVFASCQQRADSQTKPFQRRDTAINVQNSFTEMFFDSSALERFLRHAKLNDSIKLQIREFYNVRNYQFAWFSEGVPNEQAVNFWNLQSNYIANTGDSSIYNPMLQHFADSIQQPGTALTKISETAALPYELGLTEQFFRYAVKAYQGGAIFVLRN